MSKIIKAVFTGRFCTTRRVFQWDTDDKLQFVNLDLPQNYTVDFANSLTGQSVSVLATSDTVQIPPEMMTPDSEIYAWVWISDTNGGYTKCQATIPSDPRAQHPGLEPTPAQASAWDEAVDALNDAVADYETAISHAPIIQNGYWYIWDSTAGEYTNTNVKAAGIDGADGTDGNNAWTIDAENTRVVGSYIQCPKTYLVGPSGATAKVGDVVFISDGRMTQISRIVGQRADTTLIGNLHGAPGDPGEDGYSPTVTVTEIEGGHRVTITDEDHPQGQSFDVMDGQGGGGGSSVEPYTSNPAALGTASPGSSDKYSRGDHVHDYPNDLKAALLQIASKVAYIDDQGAAYYQDLYDALNHVVHYSVTNTLSGCTSSNSSVSVASGSSYSATITASAGYTLTGATVSITMGGVDITSTAYNNGTIAIASVSGNIVISVAAVAVTLSSISAVYTQSGTVYTTDTLDSLKADLVVTATYSDSSTATVAAADYTLSGTLTAGTSTITANYGGKTATFTVTVSEYVTNGLVMWMDGEKNGASGAHESTLTTWVDQSGNGWDWTNSGAVAGSNYVEFNGSSQYLSRSYDSTPSNVAMIEVVFSTPHTAAGLLVSGFGDTKGGNVLMGSGDGVLFHLGSTKNDWAKVVEPSWGGLHSYNSAGYRDGVYSSPGSFSSSWQYKNPAIGCYRSDGTNPNTYFGGKIYCIRMYSRILTEQEILANYAIDAHRFGIGG